MKKVSLILAVIMLLAVAVCTTYLLTFQSVTRMASERVDAIEKQYDDTYGAYSRLFEVIREFKEMYVRDIDVSEDEIVDQLIYEYLYMTGDLYADYYTAEELQQLEDDMNGRAVGIGVQVSYNPDEEAIEIFRVVSGSPAEAAGILPGDLIVGVKDAEGVWQKVSELGYNESVNCVSGEEGTAAELEIKRSGEVKTLLFRIIRAPFISNTVTFKVTDADEKVGYVRVTEFDNTTPTGFSEAFDALLKKGCDSIVVDMRGNPGGYLTSVTDVLEMILPEGPMVRTIDKEGNDIVICSASGQGPYRNVPIAVLVDENTASAAELFSSSLQDYAKRGELNATIVGVQTYGKGSMQTTALLPDGSALKVTYRLYCPPFSPNYDGVGVTPDIVVPMAEKWADRSVYLVPEAEDNQLAAAIEALHPAK